MIGYLIKRLLQLIPVFFGVLTITFIIMRVTPGDPVANMIGISQGVDPEFYELKTKELGLDKPIFIQYFIFLSRLFQGDLGRSLLTGRPVLLEIGEALPLTLAIVIASLLIAVPLGVGLGSFAALRRKSFFDNSSMVAALAGVSVPDFWLGLILALIAFQYFGFSPTSGPIGPQRMILPVLTLGLRTAGVFARLSRSAVLEIIGQDYVRAAKGRGIPSKRITYRYIIKNALSPIITVLGIYFGILIVGAFFVEVVFAWPGIGRLAVDAILERDYPVVQGVVMVTSIIFVLSNLVVDIIYVYLDPRVQLQKVVALR